MGLFAVLLLAAAAVVRRGWAADSRGFAAAGVAAGMTLVLIDRPSALAWLLFGLALTMAMLSARVGKNEDAWRWAQRLVVHAAIAVIGPWLDLMRVHRVTRRRRASNLPGLVRLLVLPVLGGAVFIALFASANPVLGELIGRLRLPPLSGEAVVRVVFWILCVVLVGGILRPRWRSRLLPLPSLGGQRLSGVTAASVTLSLVVFNLLFAVQNGLDLAILWSGAPLPDGMTLAQYAHRGAYPLIITALLAALFVLVFLRPGSETAVRPLVRWLVVIWVGQNLLLVASSLLRTADYIEAYSLTRFRIAAMIWMVLVGIGLGLICWRLLRNRSAAWLLNANACVVLAVLMVASVVDLGPLAAHWNIRQALDPDRQGARLDLCYLDTLNGAALTALVQLEQRTLDSALRDRVAAVRVRQMNAMQARQSDWRGWRWRDQRRLDRVAGMTADHPLVGPVPGGRDCDGHLKPPPRPAAAAPDPAVLFTVPLTSTAGD
ncbi:DUF4173 domain-containing protein [Brevundimonas sp.]|uniref:DUF4153 domain-containing protein n=1 Tax=Brevundimonas sp. TaxID=1871086 RepID=UPI0025B9CE28|nr:DUF4173 domain-containing protein [Brevundimonas sp.]